MEGYALAKKIEELALEKKGLDISVLDLRDLNTSFDYFVIISGSVDQHIKAIADHIRKELSKQGTKPIGYEGVSNLKWVLLDFVDVVVHIFDPETREFYDIESMWKDRKAKRPEA
ncbi:MAG: ribosome silencing factor [Candidatus Delongbacteria bacterium]